jgi:hypothetical protein
MRRFPPEQLLLLAIFLLVPLLNFLLAMWRRRQREGTRAGSFEPAAPEAPAPATRPGSIAASQAGVSGDRPRRETPRMPAETPPGAPRLKVSARLGPRDARRGVVLMAILGPCRALEPGPPPVPGAAYPRTVDRLTGQGS